MYVEDPDGKSGVSISFLRAENCQFKTVDK